MPKLAARPTLLLAFALCMLTSTAALTADNFDAEAPNRFDVPAAPSFGDSPAVAMPVPAGPAEQPHEPARSGNPLWEIPLAVLKTTRERPVFSSSRRPPPVVVAPVAVAKQPPPPKSPQEERPQLSLVGTVAGGDQSFGIFVDQASKAALRLRVGEEHQGWKLRAVQGREATFARDRQTIVLNFPEPGTVPPEPQRVELANVAPPADEPRSGHHGHP
jgi:general secretion pathway protein N